MNSQTEWKFLGVVKVVCLKRIAWGALCQSCCLLYYASTVEESNSKIVLSLLSWLPACYWTGELVMNTMMNRQETD